MRDWGAHTMAQLQIAPGTHDMMGPVFCCALCLRSTLLQVVLMP
jgi:hypothetical protein